MAVIFAISWQSSAQQWKDVIFLSNGSIVKGVIIEQVPEVSVKIQTADGNIFVYPMKDVVQIAKEQVDNSSIHTQGSSRNIRFDTSSLKIEGKKVVNEFGTVFTREQLYDALGKVNADELFDNVSRIGSFTWLGILSAFPLGGGLVATILSLAGAVPQDPWLTIGIGSTVAGIAGIVFANTYDSHHRKKAQAIIDNYRYSHFLISANPILVPAFDSKGLALAPGISLMINF
jgi:hypothetical protein